MASLGTTIRTARQKRGLTQKEAALRAGLSRAAYQNIESDCANPSISSLERALSTVGLALAVRNEIDWARLVALGLPLAVHDTPQRPLSVSLLVDALQEAAKWYLESAFSTLHQREREALESMMLAISIGWPKLYRQCVRTVPQLPKLIPSNIQGRHIKLYRIARSRLGNYL